MSNLVSEYLSAHSVHERLKQPTRMGSTGGVQRNQHLSAWLESSYSSEQMLPFMCTCSVWHPGRMLTSCCGSEDKLNDLHKVLMTSSLKAEVAKKPSEEETCLILLLICSGGLVATRSRISALCYWFWICSWFKEIEVSSGWAINLFLGPCAHASSDRQSSLRVECISFLPAINVSTVNERYFCFGGKTHPKPPQQVCLCQVLTQILSETEEQLENSALVLQLPEEKCRSKVA